MNNRRGASGEAPLNERWKNNITKIKRSLFIKERKIIKNLS